METKNKKLLLVDDDFMIRDLYEQAFRLMGYNIETAVDGSDAVGKLEQMDRLRDLILLDIKMPNMSGYDVLQYIKNNTKLKDIPVILLTSISDEGAVEKTLKLGVLGYLVKSDYEPREVVVKIEELMAKNSGKN